MSWLPDWLTGFDRANYNAGLAADEKNRQLTEDLHNKGVIDDKDYKAAIDSYDAAAAYSPDAAISEDFNKGLDEGAANIRGAVGGTVNSLISTPLKLIPWQLWVLGGLYAAFRLGAFRSLLSKSR